MCSIIDLDKKKCWKVTALTAGHYLVVAVSIIS